MPGNLCAKLPELSQHQHTALRGIHRSWLEKDVTLLHGVTSSGKTELYIHLIDYAMKQGRQALYLVPEIALTTQLTTRLQRVFGNNVLIYHSKFSDNERVEIWNRLLDDSSPKVIIGARSSVFLPFASLGLVIVDEEHESAYKQQDPAPRYNARDAAIVLARMHGAKTLLGSATPGVETYRKACTGRYGLVELTHRYEGGELPEMKIVDMTEARKKGKVKGIFSDELRADVGEALSRGCSRYFFSIVAVMPLWHGASSVAMCLSVTIVMCLLPITGALTNCCVTTAGPLIKCRKCVRRARSPALRCSAMELNA